MTRIQRFKEALKCSEAALLKNPKLIPFEWIIDQLKYLVDLEEGRIVDPLGLKKIKIGWIAVRELDGFEDIKLISLLCSINREVEAMLKERGLYVKKYDN